METIVPENNENTPAWRVIGAAVQGTAHQKSGLPCQDFQDNLLLPGGVLLIALADGAGTSGLADLGARCAVDAALSSLVSALEAGRPEDEPGWAGLVYSAYEKAQAALQRMADEMDVPLRDLASTLICTILDGEWLAAGQLGDGAVIAQEVDGTLTAVTQAQRGEYANETFFLTQEEALERLEIYVLNQPVCALAVMSDGLTRLAFKLPAYEPHLPFFQPLFAFASAADGKPQAEEQLAAFLGSARVCARTDDDKSLVIAITPSRGQEEMAGYKPAQESEGSEPGVSQLPENT